LSFKGLYPGRDERSLNEGDFVMWYGVFDMPDEIANAQDAKVVGSAIH